MDGELLADQPLGQKLIKKGFWLYFFMIIVAPVGYLTRVLISNHFSVEEVGVFYSVLWVILLLSVYNDLGLTEALQYYLPKYWIEKKYNGYKTILIFTIFAQVISGWVIALAVRFGAERLAVNHFHSPIAKNLLRILCFYFIGINFLNVLNSLFIAFQDVISSSLLEFFRQYSILWFTVAFWFTNTLNITNFSIWRILGLSMALTIGGIIFFKKYRKIFKLWKMEINKEIIKPQIKYALWVFLWSNSRLLFSQIDQQMIINILGPKDAWFYSNYLMIIWIYFVLLNPILSILFPIVTELITKKDHHKLAALQNTLYKYFSVFTLSIWWLLWALGPEIAGILFGHKFIYSGTLLIYSAPFLIFHVLFNINFGILAWLGRVRERVKIVFISLIINVVLNIIMLYFLKTGLIGAVISRIISRIILRFMSFRLIQKNEKINFNLKFFLSNAIIIAIIAIIFYMYKHNFIILDDAHRAENILYLIWGIAFYYTIIAGCNYQSIKEAIKEIRTIKNRKKH